MTKTAKILGSILLMCGILLSGYLAAACELGNTTFPRCVQR